MEADPGLELGQLPQLGDGCDHVVVQRLSGCDIALLAQQVDRPTPADDGDESVALPPWA